MEGIRHGSIEFRRANRGLFASGVVTFGLLYCVQPLMPEFSRTYGIGAAQSALSLSLPSGVIAAAMLFAGPVSDALGRKRVMTVSLLCSALIMLLSAVAPSWRTFLLLRTLLGLSLGGLPSVAMTYLAEEMHPDSIGLGMGLFIGGNAAGGLLGRLIAGVLTDYFGWHVALAAMGLIGCVATWVFTLSLPPSRHFVPRPLHPGQVVESFRRPFRDPGLPWLFAEGFVLLGCFVTLYNYIGYRFMAPPYSMSQSAVGMVFAVYVVGMFSSFWIGHLAGRLGRRKVLWVMFVLMLAGIALTLPRPVWVIVTGIAVYTFGFFGGHSVASSWVGRRAGAAKAQASSIYLFVYYLGSSIAGAVGGLFYVKDGWTGVAAFIGALTAVGLLIAVRLYFLAPLGIPQPVPLEPPMP